MRCHDCDPAWSLRHKSRVAGSEPSALIQLVSSSVRHPPHTVHTPEGSLSTTKYSALSQQSAVSSTFQFKVVVGYSEWCVCGGVQQRCTAVLSAHCMRRLRDCLKLGLTEAGAAEHFTKLIKEALASRTTQVNNAVHIAAHRHK